MSILKVKDNFLLFVYLFLCALLVNGTATVWSSDSGWKEDQSELSGYSLLNYASEDTEKEKKPGFLNNRQRLQFANLAYEAEDENQTSYEKSRTILEHDGWKLEKITGTTGGTNNQSSSTMGVMLFRGYEVVIATRGTNIQSLSDVVTDVRAHRGGLGENIRGLLFGNDEQTEKQKYEVSSQLLGCTGGRIHDGFLQTHLSMWDSIKDKLFAHAKCMNCHVSDLKIETLGHSLGGALQDLIQFNLLKDSSLGLGEMVVEQSFFETGKTAGMSFFGIHKTEPVQNKNVRGTSIEGPRVFGGEAAEEFNKRVGPGNAPHIVNGLDPVPNLPPQNMGFADAGDQVNIDTGHNPIGAHFLGNMESEAVKELNNFDKAPLKKENQPITFVLL